MDRKFNCRQLDIIVNRLAVLPVQPEVAARSEQWITSNNEAFAVEKADLTGLADLISIDHALAGELLAMANRRRPRSVGDIESALLQLGPQAVREVLLAAADRPGGGESVGVEAAALGEHAMAVAVAAEMLAEHIPGGPSPREAFVCGLLHDIGKLALATAMPKSYQRVVGSATASGGDIREVEIRLLGTDHATFGRRLAQRWLLPQPLVRAIGLHHHPPEAIAGEADRDLLITIKLADAVARACSLGFSGNFIVGDVAQSAKLLGVSEDALADITERLPEELASRRASPHPKPLAQPSQPVHASQQQLHRAHLLSDAGDDEELQYLRRFFDSMSPEASLVEVLEQIAATFAVAGGCLTDQGGAVAAYAIGEGGRHMAWLRYSAGDEVEYRLVAPRPDIDTTLANPPVSATAAFEALLADPSELGGWLDVWRCSHLPLCCGGDWVGGLIYTRQAGKEAGDELDVLTAAMALVLAGAQVRQRTQQLGEQLDRASQTALQAGRSQAEIGSMAAIGDMASGAAHELNNPLAVISGRAQLMAGRVESDFDRKAWRMMAEQAQAISDTVTELMEIASVPAPVLEPAEPGNILKSAAKAFLSSGHPQAATAKVDIEKGEAVPPVCIDKAQIEAALVELITNAVNAGGKRPSVHLAVGVDEVSGTVLLTVTDDGPGMDEQTIARAFTPFFSLQRAGRRKGLGLPRAKKLVHNSGGRMWIRARSGKGATVYVELPQSRLRRSETEKSNASKKTGSGAHS